MKIGKILDVNSSSHIGVFQGHKLYLPDLRRLGVQHSQNRRILVFSREKIDRCRAYYILETSMMEVYYEQKLLLRNQKWSVVFMGEIVILTETSSEKSEVIGCVHWGIAF